MMYFDSICKDNNVAGINKIYYNHGEYLEYVSREVDTFLGVLFYSPSSVEVYSSKYIFIITLELFYSPSSRSLLI